MYTLASCNYKIYLDNCLRGNNLHKFQQTCLMNKKKHIHVPRISVIARTLRWYLLTHFYARGHISKIVMLLLIKNRVSYMINKCEIIKTDRNYEVIYLVRIPVIDRHLLINRK